MDMNKEKWINEVMNSLDDANSAEANPFLYDKILNKISSDNLEYAPMKLVWLAAAAFTLLVVLNFKIIRSGNSSSKNISTEAQTLASSYQLLNENALNYNQ
jgi:hypothetical protein